MLCDIAPYHRVLQHLVTWQLHILEWKNHLHFFESLKTNFIIKIKQHYQQISLNHGTQLVNQNDIIPLILHRHFILPLQITTGPDAPLNTTFIFLFLQLCHRQ